MFKLPLLQPHLTGTAGVEGRRELSSYNAFSTFNGGSRSGREGLESAPASYGPLEVKSWEAQARDITTDIASSEKYKSLVLHAEVKLAEALERCNRVYPVTLTATGEEKPNRLRTAVCCQLLGEFADLCGPFASVLKSLRDELLKSVYSGYYVSEKGLLVFDQLTWFAVAERLEREKEVMLEEREKFQKQLAEQQDCLLRIEEQLATYQRAMNNAQVEAASMKSRMESLVVMHDAAKIEAKTGREELKRARKEWLKMKDELDAEREAHKQTKAAQDQSLQEIKDLQAGQAKLQESLAEALRQVDMRIPAEAIDGMKQQQADVTAQLEAAKARIVEQDVRLAQLGEQVGSMTPRPSRPQELKAHGIQESARTQEVVSLAASKLQEYASERDSLAQRHGAAMQRQAALEQQVELLEAALLPEPLPHAVQLSVTTETSAYFITEGEDLGGSGAPSSLAAEGLGLGPDVPRCLRWPSGQMVQLEAWSQDLEATERLVASIWEAKRAFDQSHVRQHPLSFLYTFFSSPDNTMSVTGHAAVVRQSYSLFHACSSHAESSPSVQLLSAVLTGHMCEEAAADRQAMLTGLWQVLSALPAVPGSGEESVSISIANAQECIQHFFPRRGQLQVHRLKEALASSFPGSAIPLAALHVALEPPHAREGLVTASEAAAAAAAARVAPGRELVELLSAQHLEELEAFGEQVATTVTGAGAGGGAGGEASAGTATLDGIAAALNSVLPKADVTRCIEVAMGLAGLDRGVDVASASPGMVDATRVAGLLRAFCLLRPHKHYDIAGAQAWVQSRS